MVSGIEKIMMWCKLTGTVSDHHGFIDNVERNSTLWYFSGTVGDKKITFNYRKYGTRVVLYRCATVETGRHVLHCDTITKLKQELNI